MRKSIQFIITVSFSLFSVFAIGLLGLLLYEKFSQTEEQSAIISTQQIVEQVSYNLEDYVRGMTEVFKVIDDTVTSSSIGDNRGTINDELDTIMRTREDIVSLALFSDQGELLTNRPMQNIRHTIKLTDQSWFKSATRPPTT